VSSQRKHSAEFQVHYLGSSADLAALRRSMEARGAVSRSRLTPTVTAVVADTTVPANHPTLLAAHELGIDVFEPAQAIDRLLALPARVRPRPMPLPVASTPLITVTVLVLVGVLALLGFVGVLTSESPSQTTTVQKITEGQ
jgi:hypothetical protein